MQVQQIDEEIVVQSTLKQQQVYYFFFSLDGDAPDKDSITQNPIVPHETGRIGIDRDTVSSFGMAHPDPKERAVIIFSGLEGDPSARATFFITLEALLYIVLIQDVSSIRFGVITTDHAHRCFADNQYTVDLLPFTACQVEPPTLRCLSCE